MITNVLHDIDDCTMSASDSGIHFETACGPDNLRVRQIGEVTEIALGDRGVIDAGCITKFYEQIIDLVQHNRTRVLILDMKGAWFLPSKTLGALLALGRVVERVELRNVSKEVRDALRSVHMEEIFNFVDE